MKQRRRDQLSLSLKNLSKSRTILSDTSVSLADMGIEQRIWTDAVDTFLEDRSLSPHAKRKLIEKASRKYQDLNVDDFLKAYHREKEKYLSQPTKKYCVVFPVFGPDGLTPRTRLSINSIWIEFNPSIQTPRYRRILNARAEQQKVCIFPKVHQEDLARCRMVICTLAARDEFDAVHFAEVSLRTVLGIVSFCRSYGQVSMSLSGNEAPIAPLLIAPHITVHNSNGSLATRDDLHWYVEWRPDLHPQVIPKDRADKISAKSLEYLNIFRKSKFRNFLQNAFIGYHEAFSDPNQSNAMLKAWRLLERVSGCEQGQPEKAVLRAANLFSDYENAKVIGEHLKLRRNEMVHGDPSLSERVSLMPAQLKKLIDPMLLRILHNKMKLGSVEDYWFIWEEMSKPVGELRRRQKLIEITSIELDRREKARE